MKNTQIDNGLCSCIGNKTCANCLFYLKHNTPDKRKALCEKVAEYLVSKPTYQYAVSKALETVFPNKIIYEDEKDICWMIFEAVLFEDVRIGITHFSYFVEHAPLSSGYKRLYEVWNIRNLFGFFIVKKIVPEKEVHLTDLIGKAHFKVYEKQGTSTLKKGAVIIVRIVPFLDGWMFYSETIVSHSGVTQEWMENSYGVKVSQLMFAQKYRKKHNRQWIG